MSTVPTFNSLFTSVLTDLKNRLGITSIIGKAFLSVFAAVQAGKLKIFYLAIARVQDNVYPDTADDETLQRFGSVKLGRTAAPATAGEYFVTVTGSIGATIAPETTYKSLDTSTSPDKLFVLDTLFTFSATSGTIRLRAFEGGADAKLEVGDQVQVTAPIANVDSFGTVASVEITPVEAETSADYRLSILESFLLEPQGGARTDYRLWSDDAGGVRKVYPYVKIGSPGEINLFVEANIADSIDSNGTPTAAILSDVIEVIEFDPDTTKVLNERGRRPMGTFAIDVLAITTLSVDVEITNLSDLTLVTSIQAAIENFLFDVRPFVDGADDPNNQNIGKLFASQIFNVVLDTIGGGETIDSLTVKVSSNLISVFTFENGDIPFLDNLTTI